MSAPVTSVTTSAAGLVVGAALTRLRRSLGLNRSTVAALSGISAVAVLRHEQGIDTNEATVAELLHHYGTSYQEHGEALLDLAAQPGRDLVYDDAGGWQERIGWCYAKAPALRFLASTGLPQLADTELSPATSVTLYVPEALVRRITAGQPWEHAVQNMLRAPDVHVLLLPGTSTAPMANAAFICDMAIGGHDLIAEAAGVGVIYRTGRAAACSRDAVDKAAAPSLSSKASATQFKGLGSGRSESSAGRRLLHACTTPEPAGPRTPVPHEGRNVP